MKKLGYSPAEAAELLGIGRSLIYRLISSGRLRAVKLGARTLIPASELERLLAGDGADEEAQR